jgi:hypothetical protein
MKRVTLARMSSRKSFPILTLIFVLVIMAIGILPAHGQESTPEATELPVLPLPTEGQLYSPMTFPVAVDPLSYTNPFDSEDIEVLGIFKSPSGRQLVIPGFWMQPYEDQCEQPCTVENLQPSGDPTWQIRFTPQETGDWSVSIQVRDGSNLLPARDAQFTVSPSDKPGFIRVGANKRYFQYTDGQTYFPIGHNLKWSWDEVGGLYAYRDWLRQLSESGGNYARLFIDEPWFIGLEWDTPAGDYRGAGAQTAAARLDAVLEAAAEYGVKLQLVLLWHQSLTVYKGTPVNPPATFPRPDINADWDNNPYNILYGGPIGGPAVFFFNDQAKELFRRRLRYIVSRWGYSPDIFAWEVIDEIDGTAEYDSQVSAKWLNDTASYLKELDQQGHLVTVGSAAYDALVASTPPLDFTTTQVFQRRPIETVSDQTTLVVDAIRRNLDTNPIPNLLTSYSLNPWYEPTEDDPQGAHFQDTLWASVLSGAGGAGASDWWDTYVIPQGLQQYYAPVASFVSGIDWPNLNLQPTEAGLIAEDGGAYQPVRIDNFDRQFATGVVNTVVMHTITPDGVFPSIENVSSYLYGRVYNNQLSQTQIYEVTAPINTYLEVGVRRVSPQANARLNVMVDGQSAIDLVLSLDSKPVAVRVPLAAGSHEIVLDNMGDDWLELDYLEIGQLLAPARALTLRDSTAGIALAWLQHRDYTWDKVATGVTRQPVTLRYQLNQMPPGLYSAEIWDPLTGAVVGEDLVRVREDGILSVTLLPMDSMMALRVFRQTDTATATLSPDESPDATSLPAVPTEAPTITPLLVQTNTPRPGN